MPVSKKARGSDPYRIEARLEKLIDVHLRDMETNPDMVDPKMRLSTIQYVGMFLNRKYGWGDPEDGNVGSAVRKYSGAFRTAPHVIGGRADRARPARTYDADTEESAA